jgi:hypothetical protein
MKRAGDSSIFLGESADKALESMILNVGSNKSLSGLLTALDCKSANQRAKVTYFIYLLTKYRGSEFSSLKEFETLKTKLPKLLQDQSPDSRSAARGIVRELLSNSVIQRNELEFYIPGDQIEKIIQEKPSKSNSFLSPKISHSSSNSFKFDEAMNNEDEVSQSLEKKTKSFSRARTISDQTPPRGGRRGQDISSPVPAGKLAKLRLSPEDTGEEEVAPYTPSHHDHHEGSPRARKQKHQQHSGTSRHNHATATAAKKIMDADPELQQWQSTVMVISTSKSLNEKKDALSFMGNLILKHYETLRDVGKLEISLDTILDKLTDGSIKIVQHAMDLFEQIATSDKAILESCNILQFIIPKLLGSVSSSNR